MLEKLKDLLEHFEWVTDEFQTNSVSISRVYPCVTYLKHKLTETNYSLVHTKKLREDLMASLTKRFAEIITNEVFVLSTFLDPNFGLDAFPLDKKPEIRSLVSRIVDAVDSSKNSGKSQTKPTKPSRTDNQSICFSLKLLHQLK